MAQGPLSLVCIEPRFPGRLGGVADWLVRKRGYRCRFFCNTVHPGVEALQSVGRGLDVIVFPVGGAAREAKVSWTQALERGLCYAYGCWEALEKYPPRSIDLILGHSAGLGASLFAPVHARHAPVVNLFEYWFHPSRHDLAEEPDRPSALDYTWWRRSANAMNLLDLENDAWAWAPTAWQRDLFPPEYRSDFTVLFDGVDAARPRPFSGQPRRIADRVIASETRVVSFVARRLDKLRGFDRFLRLATHLLATRSDVLCVAVGGREVDHGLDVQFFGKDYAAFCLDAAPPPDPSRLWLPGEVASSVVSEVLAASDLHIYPSRPYPVSRSFVEALAAGCVVLAWDTEPVREFLSAGRTGLLTPPDDMDAAVAAANVVLDDPDTHRPLADAGAELVRQTYSRDVTLPRLAEWFSALVAARG